MKGGKHVQAAARKEHTRTVRILGRPTDNRQKKCNAPASICFNAYLSESNTIVETLVIATLTFVYFNALNS
jgi:hypothetical protein|tara:strand:- start:11 stop:223 length:213 start_codon:yes stop_codon:yes gene_type:complete